MSALVFSYYNKPLTVGGTLLSNPIPANLLFDIYLGWYSAH